MTDTATETKEELTAQAEALDAEHARIMEEITAMNEKLTTVGLARRRAWDKVDYYGKAPRKYRCGLVTDEEQRRAFLNRDDSNPFY
jgi:hypothetical protein